MRILLLSPNQISRYNRTHQIFRNEIGRQNQVTYYGSGYPNYIPNKPIPQVVKELGDFDIIMTYGLRYTEPFIGIGEIKVPRVHIAVDYFPVGGGSGTYERNHRLFRRDKYNLYFGVVGDIVKNLVKNGVCKKAFLLPFSIDTNIYNNLNLKKDIDVFAVFSTGNNIYPNRERIQRFIKSMNGVSTFTKKVVHRRYINMINRSKLCITSNNKFRSLSIKYYEIMACGSLLLADEPEDLNTLGFVNGEHLILYTNNLKDLKNKIKYCLSHDKEREEIANNGMKFIREKHSNEIRVKQMTEIIREELGIK